MPKPPVEPGAEEAPTTPEQVPGAGEPIIPPTGDINTGQRLGDQFARNLDLSIDFIKQPEGSPAELEQGLGVEPGLAGAFLDTPPQPEPQQVAGLFEALRTGLSQGARRARRGPVSVLTPEEMSRILDIDPAEASAVLGTKPLKFPGRPENVAELNTLLKQFVEARRGQFEKARGGRTDVETRALIRKEMSNKFRTYLDVLDIREDALTEVETGVVLNYLQASVTDLRKLIKKAAEGDAGAVQSMPYQMGLVDALITKIAPFRREAGASVRLFGQAQESVAEAHAIHDAVSFVERMDGVDPQRLALVLNGLPDETILGMMKGLNGRKPFGRIGDEIASTFIDALLLSASTQSRNVLGNFFRALTILPERALESQIGRGAYLLGSSTVHHVPGEATIMAQAIPQGIKAAFAAMGQLRREGVSAFSGHKIEVASRFQNVFHRGNLPIGSPEWFKRGIDRFGHAWALGSKGLFYADEAFKMMLYTIERQAVAFRYAQLLGDTVEKRGDIYEKLIKNPPESIKREAMLTAQIGTYTAHLGPFGSAVSQVADSYNPITRLVLTFVTANGNMAKQSFQRLPLLNALSMTNAQDFARGGIFRDAAIARWTSGGIVGAGFAGLAANQLITGTGTGWSKEYRQQKEIEGWKPCAAWSGDRYVPISDLGPWATVACATADFVEIYDKLGPDDAEAAAEAFALAWGFLIFDTGFMEQPARFFKEWAEGDPEKLANFVRRTAEGFVPRLPGEAANVLDPERKVTRAGGGSLDTSLLARQLATMAAELTAKTPIAKGTLVSDRGPLGEVLTSRTLYGTVTGYQESPVYVGMRKAELPGSILNVPRFIGGSGKISVTDKLRVPLTPGQQGLGRTPGITIFPEDVAELYLIRSKLKDDGQTLAEALVPVLNDKSLSNGPGGTKEQVVRKIVRAYNILAFEAFDKTPAAKKYPSGSLLEASGIVKERRAERRAGER